MKIAVWHNLPSGGGKRALYYHVRGLVERGHTVESWCPPTADQTYLPLKDLITEHVVPMPWQPRTAKTRFGTPAAYYYNVVGLTKALDQHCRQCAEEINRGKFDLLFTNSCRFLRTTSIGRHVKIPKVIYLQEPNRQLYEALPRLPWIALPAPKNLWSAKYLADFFRDLIKLQGLRIHAREELLNARAFDAILVNSYYSRESVLRAYGLDAKVCYLGIDTRMFINQHRSRENFVVGVGAIVAEKNIKFTIEALAEVREPRPRLVWIGNVAEPTYLEGLTRYAHSVGVSFEPRVGVDDHQLVEILNRAMLMVYAPHLEPFGFAPLEANACGLPVVAVAEGGVRETVIDGVNGMLIDHDPSAMAAAIEHLISDRESAERLRQAGSNLVVERWSLDASIDRLECRFRELINGKRV